MNGFTHYAPRQGGGFHLFEMGFCENCREPVTEANAVNTPEPETALQRLGFHRAERMPPKVEWSDDLGHCVCERCE